MQKEIHPEKNSKEVSNLSFEDLKLEPHILKAISKCGYSNPTPVQARAIPEALAGHDLIATAQTGTGKTAAYVLPSLQHLATSKSSQTHGPKILVLVPTRELAYQVIDSARTYGKYTQVRSAVILGGMPYGAQIQALSRPLDIIVATPGRFIDHLDQGRIDLSNLNILVLDEADRMLDMGFSEDVEKIVAATPSTRQTMLFTATMDRTMEKLAGRILKAPRRIEVAGKKVSLENIEQKLHVADNLKHKHDLLKHLIKDKKLTKAIVFSATKKDTDTLARDLKRQGYAAEPLHGDMSQSARNRTIRGMHRGNIRLLVATDVAARGLDVNGISHVINFDIPKFAEDYVHRIGRTGRAGASGVAISFVTMNDISCLERIQKYLGNNIPQHTIEGLEALHPLQLRNSDRNKKYRSGHRSGSNVNVVLARPAKGRSANNRGQARKVEVVYKSKK
ncbi:MAG: DEAD/DEAH box helicase [Proteobacteria bacterium]|nr:DEAD/DEAH box helicase [Pseudomonadota bacterium]